MNARSKTSPLPTNRAPTILSTAGFDINQASSISVLRHNRKTPLNPLKHYYNVTQALLGTMSTMIPHFLPLPTELFPDWEQSRARCTNIFLEQARQDSSVRTRWSRLSDFEGRFRGLRTGGIIHLRRVRYVSKFLIRLVSIRLFRCFVVVVKVAEGVLHSQEK